MRSLSREVGIVLDIPNRTQAELKKRRKATIELRKRIDPFRRLPNVADYTVGVVKPSDTLWAEFGITKVVRAEAIYTEYENKKMNRYIGYQVLALNKARHNPEAFWKLVEHIMRSSDAFQILALNHCWPQWQRHKK